MNELHTKPGGLKFSTTVALLGAIIIGSMLFVPNIINAVGNDQAISTRSWSEVKPEIMKYKGVPYVFGGKTKSGWDCTGFVGSMLVWSYGTDWPGGSPGECGSYAVEKMLQPYKIPGSKISSVADYHKAVDAKIIQPGDIIQFFNKSGNPCHAAIVTDDYKIMHAWYEGFGTNENTFADTWNANGVGGLGSGKKNWKYIVAYRGLSSSVNLEIAKTSTDPTFSESLSTYSLKGAQFEILDTNNKVIAKATTNSQGTCKVENLPAGAYTVKEVKPPLGFKSAEQEKKVNLTQNASINIANEPLASNTEILITKYDAESQKIDLETPQGNAELFGAQFKINYYDTFDDVTSTDKKPKRSWVMQTDSNGKILFENDSATFKTSDGKTLPYKISGDPFFTNKNGETIIPLGTITIQEIKAPRGYITPENTPIQIQKITAGTEGKITSHYTPASIPNDVIRGDISVSKYAEHELNSEDTPELKAALENIEFNIINTSTNAVINAEGSIIQPGETVCTITTNEDGFATTKQEGKVGALPYGTYQIEEVSQSLPDGYKPIESFEITISKEQEMRHFTLENKTGTALKVLKVDQETGQLVQGKTSFTLLDENNQKVEFLTTYPSPTTFSTLTTNDEGECLLPQKLQAGTYKIVEVVPPHGYTIDDKPVEVKLDGSTVNTFALPFQSKIANKQQKGKIRIIKTDHEGNLIKNATAQFEIYAAGDIITPDGTTQIKDGALVDTIHLNEDGIATTEELYLGSYDIVEVKSPDGYIADRESKKRIELSYAGPTVDVVAKEIELKNKPNELLIQKIDKRTKQPLKNAEFIIWNVTDSAEEQDIPPENTITVVTDDQGVASLKALAPGKYACKESVAPKNYLSNSEIFYFEVDENSYINGEAQHTIVVENEQTHLEISKVDISTSKELPGNTLTVYTSESGDPGKIIETWVSKQEPHIIKGLKPGKYILVEEQPVKGYTKAECIEFTIEATGETQHVYMENRPEPEKSFRDKNSTTKSSYRKTGAVGALTKVAVLGSFSVASLITLYAIRNYK